MRHVGPTLKELWVSSTREKEKLPVLPTRSTSSEDMEGDKLPPAPDQELESNWIFQEPIY